MVIKKGMKTAEGGDNGKRQFISVTLPCPVVVLIILLTAMEYLRDQIISAAASPELTRKYIDTYRYNADKIIKIIQDIED